MTCSFPPSYLEHATGSQMVRDTRRNPAGGPRFSGVQIMLSDNTQRVITYPDPDEAREAAYQFALQAMRVQGKTTA